MNFPKFKLIQDFEIESEFAGIKTKQIIFEKGKEFLPNENDLYIIEWLGGKLEFNVKQMREANNNNKSLFEEQKSKYEMIITEVDDDDENLVGNWRIQLDVKVTRKKLKEIEKIIRDNVMPLI